MGPILYPVDPARKIPVGCCMALFGFGKEKKVGDSSETVLAYLEDAQRVRTPITVLDARKKSVTATIQGINEAEGTLTLQMGGPLIGAEKGARIDLIFMADPLRLGLSTKALEVRSGAMVLELPESIELMERRSTPRARLNPKEGATLTALSSIFEGVGLSGLLENISEGGCRVRVEKAINIKDEKRLPLGEALVPVGHPFMLLKLNKVPKCTAVMELAGKVAYLESTTGGLVVGLSFDKPRADLATMIRNLVSSRCASVPSTLPPKARRRQEVAEDNLLPEHPAPRPTPVREEKSSKPSAVSVVEAVAEAAVEEIPKESVVPRNNALIRLKKRSRAVVALVSTQEHADELSTFLDAQGYGRVFLAQGMAELRELLRQPNLGLLLFDCEISFLDLLEVVRSLHDEFHHLPHIVLAAEEVSRGTVIAAQRVGISQLLVKPYALDEAFNAILEDLLD